MCLAFSPFSIRMRFSIFTSSSERAVRYELTRTQQALQIGLRGRFAETVPEPSFELALRDVEKCSDFTHTKRFFDIAFHDLKHFIEQRVGQQRR